MILNYFLVIWTAASNNGEEPHALVYVLAFLLAFGLFVVWPVIGILQWIGSLPPLRIKPQNKIYLGEIPFYNNLNPPLKKTFERRVQYFINQKQFISRSRELVIDDRKKVLIAATAIELSFGLGRFVYDHFKRILIYSDDYYSNISKQYHQGEVNIRGLIVLSWSNFEKGNSNRSDGINLGVHEMAHALKLENKIANRNYNFISPADYQHFSEAYLGFCSGYGEGHGFLREYAKTNIHEFFAVSCENFIERPLEFRRNAPGLYRIMTRILRQDPARLL